MTDTPPDDRSTRPGPGRGGRPVRRALAALCALCALCALSLGGAGLTGTPVVGSPAAAADPLPDCSTTVGVVVAVDFSHWGQDIQRGCDATVSTALAALQADFAVTGTAQYGLAFVCLIDGEPSDQSCDATPPASASWSLWYADVGQSSWTYAESGAATLRPQAGSVEAWTFGAAETLPSFPPGSVRATNTEPVAPGATPTTSPPTTAPAAPTAATTPTTGGGSPPTGGTTPTATAPTGGATTTTTTLLAPAAAGATTTTTTRPGAATPTHPATGAGHPRIVDASPLSAHQTSPGSPVPLIVGSALVVALAGLAGLVAWRRRQGE
jgi:MYXO-CTERM domain-containing protein